MIVPELNHATWAILAALSGGDPVTPAELLKALDWRTAESNLNMMARRLQRQGLLTRSRVVVRTADGGTAVERHYRITADGRTAFLESLDWYQQTAARFAETPPVAATGDVVESREYDAERGEPQGGAERGPTDAERARLLELSKERFAAFYIAATGLEHVLQLGELFELTVQDFDRGTRELIVRGRRVAVDDETAAAILRAIGGRQSGPMFLSNTGLPMTVANATATYRRLREKSGIDRSVKLRGRQHAELKRPKRAKRIIRPKGAGQVSRERSAGKRDADSKR